MRVLITGGAGFIGSHLAERLLRARKRVAIVDSLDDYYDPELKRANLREIAASGQCEFRQVDIREGARIQEVFRSVQPEGVVHLAARPGVRASFLQPQECVSVNVLGTLEVLEACRQNGVGRLVFASSSSVYGQASKAPFKEDASTCQPLSIYAASKASAEALAFTFSQAYGLSVVCIRLFTAFGPRQRPDLAIRKFASLIVAGNEVPIFGDGSLERDFTYIEDIIEGIVRALEVPASFEIFNLGNAHPVRLDCMVRTLEQALKKPVRMKFLPIPPGEMLLTHADLTKARRILGYSPQIGFEDGIRRFVAWLEAQRTL